MTEAKAWTYEPLDPDQIPNKLQRVQVRQDSDYLSVFLRSMRVTDVRKGLKKFYGVVHCFSSLQYETGKKATFHMLTTPEKLANINSKDLDRVITGTQRLLGPIPYRGGDVEIELGLFSIEFADLAGPYLNVLEDMAKTAGVSYINQALPFVNPILNGINILCGAQNDSPLEIGLKETLQPPETGCYVVMRAPKGTVDVSQCKLDRSYQLVDANGESVTGYPYMVFSIEASNKRDGWSDIPDLADAFDKLTAAARTGNVQVTKDALEVFRRTALTSPDLTRDDASKLVAKVTAEFTWALTPPTVEKARMAKAIPSLKKIKLYG